MDRIAVSASLGCPAMREEPTVVMRWHLNDLSRRLDEWPAAVPLAESYVAASPRSTGTGQTPDGRLLYLTCSLEGPPMAGNPQVLGLLEELLDSGKTPEQVCHDCPELLPEVRRRWREFRHIDAQVAELL